MATAKDRPLVPALTDEKVKAMHERIIAGTRKAAKENAGKVPSGKPDGVFFDPNWQDDCADFAGD